MNPSQLNRIFQQIFGVSPTVEGRAPGRVNLLGEHVDYNNGAVLPAAIDRQVRLAAVQVEEPIVRLHAIDLGELAAFDLRQVEARRDIDGKPLPHWALFPAGVAWALRDAGLETSGMYAAFTSDIPIGSGLSSSAAVEVGFGVIWQTLVGWQIEPMALAQICQKAENQYVGVSCGLMDQFACVCGVEGHALYFDTRSLEWQPAPLPPGLALVIADSGVRRSLTNSAYNDRRAACEKAVAELQQFLPHIRSLRDVLPTEFAAYSIYLSDEPRKRAEHVIKEIARVETALNALHRQDRKALGALMYAGHNSLRYLYEVSIPELDTLVELSRNLPGCIGARLTGAGFGGCTINLVEQEHVASFIQGLKEGYLAETGRTAAVFACHASQGATTWRV